MQLIENTTKIGNLSWFYRQTQVTPTSDKTPVILLHGLPSQSYSWCEIMSVLNEYEINAIAPDWIGCGLSDKTDKRDFKYTPSAYIQALSDFIDSFKMPKISLVVQGFLGSVGIQYALRNPDKIDQLVILNTPLSPNVKLPKQMKQWGLPFIGDMLTQNPLIIDQALENGSGFVISDRDLSIYRKPITKSSDAGRSIMAIVKNLQLSESMKEINSGLREWHKPTMIIWGKQDPWLDFADVEDLVKGNSEIKLVTFDEAKHYPQKHWFKEISPILINFLGN